MSETNIEAAMASMRDDPLPNPNVEDVSEPSKVEQPRSENGQFVSPDQDEPAQARDSADPALNGESLDSEEPAGNGDSENPDEQQRRPNNRKSFSERLNQVTAQKHEALARARVAEQRLQELQYRLTQEVDPDLEFTDPTAWNTAQFEKVLDQREARQVQIEAQWAAEQAYNANLAAFEEAAETARERIPDFDQVVYRPDVPFTQAAVEFFGESEHSADIAYYLGKNPKVAQQIASQPPHKQWAELARIEARVSARPQKRTTAAPPPARAVTGGGGTSGQMSPQDASVEDIGRLLGYGRKS